MLNGIHEKSAVWKNPNDLAILLTAKHYAKYERAAVRTSTVCVANSEATKADFQARYDPPENWRCEVVRWGVDTNMFVPLDRDHEDTMLAHEEMRRRFGEPDENALAGLAETETPLILAVGRLVARKGYRTLLKAMPAVLEAYPEGQGLIPLEAMASGTPVVTVDDGPLPEMVDETVGGLFDINQPDTLATAINALLNDPEQRENMAANGRRRVLDEYTYSLNAERYAEYYATKD